MKHQSNDINIYLFRYGFTLIELLVGLTLILTIGTIVFAIFVASIRGTNKSTSLNLLRQNGSSAMDQIVRSIRGAKQFDGVSLTGTDSFSDVCQIPDGQSEPTQYKAVQVTTFDDEQMVYRCPLEGEHGLYENDIPLIDTDRVFVSQQNACHFTCIKQGVTSAPVIGVSFTLSTNVQSDASDVDTSLPFQTTVSPRNFMR